MKNLYEPASVISSCDFAGIGDKPAVFLPAWSGEVTISQASFAGSIRHIWMTPEDGDTTRTLILRIYWDDCDEPAVECPLGDFFCAPTRDYKQISGAAVCSNPAAGYNSYFEMPFGRGYRLTMENRSSLDRRIRFILYFEQGGWSEGMLYFHAQFNRINPLPYKEVHTILPGAEGSGAYAGTFLFQGVNNNLWWGEGEIKFYMDDDTDYPTICGTGTEDYFGGSFDFNVNGSYTDYSTPCAGFAAWPADRMYHCVQRFGMYRFHLPDPVYFKKRLHITLQALGWRSEGRYCPRQDDMATVAYFYLDSPCTLRPNLGDRDCLEII